MKQYTSWIIIIIATVAIIGGAVWYAGQPGQYDKFATCIKQSGATFFGAFWCPHCQEEKSYFGKSWTNLPYVECSTPDGQGQTEACKQNKIESYPTWHFKDGTVKTGTLSLGDLATFTGCPLVKGN
jgi:hypothetical protein